MALGNTRVEWRVFRAWKSTDLRVGQQEGIWVRMVFKSPTEQSGY